MSDPHTYLVFYLAKRNLHVASLHLYLQVLFCDLTHQVPWILSGYDDINPSGLNSGISPMKLTSNKRKPDQTCFCEQNFKELVFKIPECSSLDYKMRGESAVRLIKN